MMTELENWRADQYQLVNTPEGPKLVRKNNRDGGVEFCCEQPSEKPRRNGKGGIVLYWGANKPDNK